MVSPDSALLSFLRKWCPGWWPWSPPLRGLSAPLAPPSLLRVGPGAAGLGPCPRSPSVAEGQGEATFHEHGQDCRCTRQCVCALFSYFACFYYFSFCSFFSDHNKRKKRFSALPCASARGGVMLHAAASPARDRGRSGPEDALGSHSPPRLPESPSSCLLPGAGGPHSHSPFPAADIARWELPGGN